MIHSKIKKHIVCLLFSLILLVSVSASSGETVLLGGMPFGIRFHAGEVSVIKMNSFESFGKTVSPADEAGLLENDIITKVNSKEIRTVTDFVSSVDAEAGKVLDVTVKRGDKEFNTKLVPKICDETGKHMLGILLKDSSAGIGTVTFIDRDSGVFAGLGHGICDSSTGKVLPIDAGYISKVKINGITKGSSGSPGELRGSLGTEKCGKLLSNKEVGVFGVFTEDMGFSTSPIPVGTEEDVKPGNATIFCTLDDNKREEYSIEILEVNNSIGSKTKNYVIKVTDKELLEKTGGIVQGMSGSPIVQNGKLVGAVTHVFVNDPTKGYGIFIKNMLTETKK